MILLGIAGCFGFIFAERIVTIFRDDPEVITIGTAALRFQSVSLLFLPITVTGNMLFQSTGKSVRATFLAATRSGLFFIPTILILRGPLGLTGIECSQAIADFLGGLTTIPFVVTFLRSFPPDGEPS
jgi:Na+-driven multidrug efflux pump